MIRIIKKAKACDAIEWIDAYQGGSIKPIRYLIYQVYNPRYNRGSKKQL